MNTQPRPETIVEPIPDTIGPWDLFDGSGAFNGLDLATDDIAVFLDTNSETLDLRQVAEQIDSGADGRAGSGRRRATRRDGSRSARATGGSGDAATMSSSTATVGRDRRSRRGSGPRDGGDRGASTSTNAASYERCCRRRPDAGSDIPLQ
ncbi:MAG: hypothetical protein WKF58_09515 [Ilumatobacteraceae bacterium]